MSLALDLKRRLADAYATIFARPALASYHYFLLKLAYRGLGVMNYRSPTISGERYLIFQLLPGLVTNDCPVFFDIGANQGDYAKMLSQKFPAARIFAYEPHPLNYDALVRAAIPGVLSFNEALGEEVGETELYDYATGDGSTNASLFRGVIDELRSRPATAHRVRIGKLDAIADALGIGVIDLLKIDTEGAELLVLRGAGTLLREGRIRLIQFEFNEMNLISRAFFHDFRSLLKGYSLYRLMPRGLLPISPEPLLSELFGYQNILAVAAAQVRRVRDSGKTNSAPSSNR
jgi:FkbM family methyltransferase